MTIQNLLDFLLLREPNVLLVVAGSIILCGMSAIVGCFTFLRKRALIGDAVSHSVLPGVCLAFILTGEKNPLYFLIGAIISGMLSLIIMEGLTRSRQTRPDIKLGICGEHGGDPASIAFFHDAGLAYVSCSPFRVPVARLAAARAAVLDPALAKSSKAKRK